jgi:hypothetical protein
MAQLGIKLPIRLEYIFIMWITATCLTTTAEATEMASSSRIQTTTA